MNRRNFNYVLAITLLVGIIFWALVFIWICEPADVPDYMVWGFGDPPYKEREMPDLWNKRHPDLFTMYGTDEVKESLCRAKAEYERWKEKNDGIVIGPNCVFVLDPNTIED